MAKLVENLKGYFQLSQRDILIGLLDNEMIRNNFFLTGGTALAVFYLHHRTSIDLDFFNIEKSVMGTINLWITQRWPGESKQINQNEYILQMLIKGVKVDIVYDPLSFKEERQKYHFGRDKFLTVDSLRNIASNKLNAMVSRREIKDFVDFFYINKMVEGIDIESIYKDAQKKEGMFDDSPTVAYQLECNLGFIKENVDIFPRMMVKFDIDEFYRFYEGLVDKIYRRVGIK